MVLFYHGSAMPVLHEKFHGTLMNRKFEIVCFSLTFRLTNSTKLIRPRSFDHPRVILPLPLNKFVYGPVMKLKLICFLTEMLFGANQAQNQRIEPIYIYIYIKLKLICFLTKMLFGANQAQNQRINVYLKTLAFDLCIQYRHSRTQV